jgi:tetratricopeptide (TPR) repeat protein
MKKLIPLFASFLIIAFISSCQSAKQAYEKGNYDKAIQLAAKKLRKKPDDQKTIDYLVNSWEISNRVDKEDLNRELSSSNPDWEKVYALYRKLDDRQRVVMQLPKLKPTNPQTNVDFQFEDYTAALDNAKQQAVDKLTKQGDDLMTMGDRFNARKAYDAYNKAFGYDPYNTAVKDKMNQAKTAGITHVLVQIAPTNQVNLPENFIKKALDKKWENLQSTWVQIHSQYQSGMVYHYYADVLVNQATVSPEKVAETSFVETKKIEDGFDYARNQDGSYKLDTLGNKIKVPVYKDVSCTVKKTTQSKETMVTGTVVIYGIDSERKYCNDNITSNYQFTNAYATAKGDSRALSKTSQDLINKKEAPFPSNMDMLMNAGPNLGNSIYDKVNQYKSNFQ